MLGRREEQGFLPFQTASCTQCLRMVGPRTTHSAMQDVEQGSPGGFSRPLAPQNQCLRMCCCTGPNNQIAGLKEALVLGQLLNRTVVVHDLLNHYTEDLLSDEPHSMPFDQVFDLAHLSAYQSVVTLSELRQHDWDLQLDAVAHFGPKFLNQVHAASERMI